MDKEVCSSCGYMAKGPYMKTFIHAHHLCVSCFLNENGEEALMDVLEDIDRNLI